MAKITMTAPEMIDDGNSENGVTSCTATAQTTTNSSLRNTTTTKRIATLQKVPGNEICADCSDKNPLWASFLRDGGDKADNKHTQVVDGTLGVLVCDHCAQHHHFELGKGYCHIKYLKYPHEWTANDLEILEHSGNRAVNELYEANCTSDDKYTDDDEKRGKFIKNKYLKCKYRDEAKLEKFLDKLWKDRGKDVQCIVSGEGNIADKGKEKSSDREHHSPGGLERAKGKSSSKEDGPKHEDIRHDKHGKDESPRRRDKHGQASPSSGHRGKSQSDGTSRCELDDKKDDDIKRRDIGPPAGDHNDFRKRADRRKLRLDGSRLNKSSSGSLINNDSPRCSRDDINDDAKESPFKSKNSSSKSLLSPGKDSCRQRSDNSTGTPTGRSAASTPESKTKRRSKSGTRTLKEADNKKTEKKATRQKIIGELKDSSEEKETKMKKPRKSRSNRSLLLGRSNSNNSKFESRMNSSFSVLSLGERSGNSRAGRKKKHGNLEARMNKSCGTLVLEGDNESKRSANDSQQTSRGRSTSRVPKEKSFSSMNDKARSSSKPSCNAKKKRGRKSARAQRDANALRSSNSVPPDVGRIERASISIAPQNGRDSKENNQRSNSMSPLNSKTRRERSSNKDQQEARDGQDKRTTNSSRSPPGAKDRRLSVPVNGGQGKSSSSMNPLDRSNVNVRRSSSLSPAKTSHVNVRRGRSSCTVPPKDHDAKDSQATRGSSSSQTPAKVIDSDVKTQRGKSSGTLLDTPNSGQPRGASCSRGQRSESVGKKDRRRSSSTPPKEIDGGRGKEASPVGKKHRRRSSSTPPQDTNNNKHSEASKKTRSRSATKLEGTGKSRRAPQNVEEPKEASDTTDKAEGGASPQGKKSSKALRHMVETRRTNRSRSARSLFEMANGNGGGMSEDRRNRKRRSISARSLQQGGRNGGETHSPRLNDRRSRSSRSVLNKNNNDNSPRGTPQVGKPSPGVKPKSNRALLEKSNSASSLHAGFRRIGRGRSGAKALKPTNKENDDKVVEATGDKTPGTTEASTGSEKAGGSPKHPNRVIALSYQSDEPPSPSPATATMATP